MRITHRANTSNGYRLTVEAMRDRCPRCWPEGLSLGCDQAGHRASALLLRAGWHRGNAARLLADLDGELDRLRNVGPLTRALVVDRLHPD